MENVKQLKRIERIIAICIFAFVVVFAVAIFSFVQVGRVRRKNAEYDEFILALEQQKENLEAGIYDMNQEDYLNEKAREQLGMIKDGETLYLYE